MTVRARPELVVATRNPGKAAELAALVDVLGFRVLTLDDAGVAPSDAEDNLEVHDTFEANARAKAAYYRMAAGGRVTVADDSGLEVDALGGTPGVRSRRWAGAVGTEREVARANNEALLAALRGCSDRSARFVCAVALADNRGVLVRHGEICGRIATSPRGTNGFGYDPLFEVLERGNQTFAEIPEHDKRAVSHRARAFAALVAAIQGLRPGAGATSATR